MKHRSITDGRAILRAYKRDPLRIPNGKRASMTEIADVLYAIDRTIEALDYVDEDDFVSPPSWAFDNIEDVFA